MKLLQMLKSTNGNSLAEFAVVIALMATLMSTGQVKFSQAGEGGKGKKVGEELDKIGKAANNFYNAMNDEEGAGRFPGQDKWDRNVPGGKKPSEDGELTADGDGFETVAAAILAAEGWKSYTEQDNASNSGKGMNWCSVFGKGTGTGEQGDFDIHPDHHAKIAADDGLTTSPDPRTPAEQTAGKYIGKYEFAEYVDAVASPFLDGHFIYTVVGGTVDTSPAMVITDFFAPADEFVVVQP